MIGVKGTPFTDSFEWARWAKSAKELRSQGATEVLTDIEAQRRGYAVRQAKSYALSQARQQATRK